MAQPGQRYACDRCHGQKLRCVRQGDGCARCAKARALCTWSPSLRGGGGTTIGLVSRHLPDAMDGTGPASKTNSHKTLKRRYVEDDSMGVIGDYNQQELQGDTRPGSMSIGGDDNHNEQAPIDWTSSQFLDFSDQLQPSNLNCQLDLNAPRPETVLGEAFDLPTFLVHDAAEPSNALVDASNSRRPHLTHTPPDAYRSAPLENPGITAYGQNSHRHRTDSSMESSPAGSSTLGSQGNPANPSASHTLSTVQELSDLNVELYAHSSSIPRPPKSTTEPLSWKGKDFAIDRTFQLSQKMIEVLNRLYPRSLETLPPNRLTPASSTSQSSPSQGELTSGNTNQGRTAPYVDQGSLLLILSCYLRLIDTYDNIFGNMQACLDRSSITAPEDYVNLPNVTVGSFSFPTTSALQITMILHLASQLLDRLREVTGSIRTTSNDDSDPGRARDEDAAGGSAVDITTMTLEAVTSRQNELVRRIKLLRQSLRALDVI